MSFQTLPIGEKRIWYSQHYDVKSRTLVALGIPELAECAYFEDVDIPYGKTFHTWQYDCDDFPYGIPQLMMGFAADGQFDLALIEGRDRWRGVSHNSTRRDRAGVPMPAMETGRIGGRAGGRCRCGWRR